MVSMAVWLNYLDRPENLREISASQFALKCSELERAGKAYLSIIIDGFTYHSPSRVLDCKHIASSSFAEAKLTLRHDQDVMFGLHLDGRAIISLEGSTNSLAAFYLVLLVFSPLFGLWVDQNRKKVATDDSAI